jgi:hypothetical protein
MEKDFHQQHTSTTTTHDDEGLQIYHHFVAPSNLLIYFLPLSEEIASNYRTL